MPSFYVFTFTVYLILALGIGMQFFFTRNRTLGLVFCALLIYSFGIPTLYLALNLFPSGLILFPIALIVSTSILLHALTNEMMVTKSFLLQSALLLLITVGLVIGLYHNHPLLTIQLSLVLSGGFLLVSTLVYWFSHAREAIPGLRGLVLNLSLWSLAKVILGVGMHVILFNPGIIGSIAVGLDGLLGFSITMSIIRTLSLRMRQQESQRLQEFTRATSFLSGVSRPDEFSALMEDICRTVSRENRYLLVAMEMIDGDNNSFVYSSRNQYPLGRMDVEQIVGELAIITDKDSSELVFLRDKELDPLVIVYQHLPMVRGIARVKISYNNRQQAILSLLKADDTWSNLEQVMTLAYASLAGILINNYQTTNRLHESVSSMVATLSTAVDARDSYTANHSRQVAKMAGYIAEQMRLSEDNKELLQTAALLHDLGKIGIPDGVLLKPESLNQAEYTIIKQHPVIGANILGMAPQVFSEIIPIVTSHHEQWQGDGYPRGLKGDEIPLGSRILAVADSLDAMVSDRVYRPGISLNQALNEINERSGSQFDPRVVNSLLILVNEHRDLVDGWNHNSKVLPAV